MQDWTPLLTRCADAVSNVVRTLPRADFGRPSGHGAAGLPTVHVDRLSENAVIAALDASGLKLDLCSEEIGNVDRGGTHTLIVDPIDGTNNCVRGVPFYCTSLAVCRTGISDVEAGLVRNLVTGDTYLAQRGKGATKNGARLRSRTWVEGEELVSQPQRSKLPPGYDALLKVPYPRQMGAAALEMALVAEGCLDGFVNSGSLRIVDIAAGTLLVEEAGGVVLGLDGKPLTVPLDAKSRTGIVAVGDRLMLKKLGVGT